MSLAVFTDSTTATASPALTFRPTAGTSTKTTSVSLYWAWSVIPTVPIWPSTRTHSWEFAYLRSGGIFELIVISFFDGLVSEVPKPETFFRSLPLHINCPVRQSWAERNPSRFQYRAKGFACHLPLRRFSGPG